MTVGFLAWFLFFLCIQAVTILGFEDYPTLRNKDFNLSKPRFAEQLHVRGAGVNFTIGFFAESDRRELKGKHEIFRSENVKGKGTYGGGNGAHHPRSHKGAASLSPSHCFHYSEAMLNLSLAMIGLLLPYFLTGF